MKNLFNDIPKSEKQRILEMHKKKGYNSFILSEENENLPDWVPDCLKNQFELTPGINNTVMTTYPPSGLIIFNDGKFVRIFEDETYSTNNVDFDITPKATGEWTCAGSTLNEVEITTNPDSQGNYQVYSSETGDWEKKTTTDQPIDNDGDQTDNKLNTQNLAITRGGKLIKREGMGAQFCYAIPITSIEPLKYKESVTQEEITEAKNKKISPWTDVLQFFKNNDAGQCRTSDQKGLSDQLGKYLYYGSRGNFVKTVQSKLANAALGKDYSPYMVMFLNATKKGKDPIDGIFGKTTASVVLEFQKDNGITPADGRVRKNTWDKLSSIPVKTQYDPINHTFKYIGSDLEKLPSKQVQLQSNDQSPTITPQNSNNTEYVSTTEAPN